MTDTNNGKVLMNADTYEKMINAQARILIRAKNELARLKQTYEPDNTSEEMS